MYVFITIIHVDLLLSFVLFTCNMGDNTNNHDYKYFIIIIRTNNCRHTFSSSVFVPN